MSRLATSMRRRDVLVAAVVALLLGVVLASPLPLVRALPGLSLDTLFWLRYQAFGQRHDLQSSPSVVIALDEETWRSDEFHDLPEVMWPPRIGEVIKAVLAGGAKVIGYDVIFPTSMENVLPGTESDYLRTLRAGATQGRIVLAKVLQGELPIAPSRAQSIAVYNEKNVRIVNLEKDPDDVIRRGFVAFESADINLGKRIDTTLSVELAARALGVKTEIGPGTTLTLGDYVVPGSERGTFLINFDAGNDVPTYPLIDLYECAKTGEAGASYFREHFAGKVVMLGYVRDIEDRKVAGKRFMVGSEHFANMPRCAGAPKTDFARSDIHRLDIPGVYIHTAAINSLMRHEVLNELSPWLRWLPGVLLAMVTGLAAITLGPLAAGLTLAGVGLAWTGVATVALEYNWNLPFLEAVLAAMLTVALLFGYRFGIADKDKRRLRQNFSLYLAPSVVDRITESDKPPELGGEQRTVSIFFSDLRDFTTLSEGLAPSELVTVINAYFDAMTEIVQSHGGYVDKYIGDAIVAVFGAPLDDPHHALHAVKTALACCKRLDEMNEDSESFHGRRLAMRIGINTGESLVGNIGSHRRFNYTVMGDSVNVASRLQDLNKRYGTTILVSEATVSAIGPAIAFRRVDRANVKGRGQSVEIFTPGDAEPQLTDADVAAAGGQTV
jgi:class 3 adenylate cyclase/CHASE2 domain-containing sensor protein